MILSCLQVDVHANMSNFKTLYSLFQLPSNVFRHQFRMFEISTLFFFPSHFISESSSFIPVSYKLRNTKPSFVLFLFHINSGTHNFSSFCTIITLSGKSKRQQFFHDIFFFFSNHQLSVQFTTRFQVSLINTYLSLLGQKLKTCRVFFRVTFYDLSNRPLSSQSSINSGTHNFLSFCAYTRFQEAGYHPASIVTLSQSSEQVEYFSLLLSNFDSSPFITVVYKLWNTTLPFVLCAQSILYTASHHSVCRYSLTKLRTCRVFFSIIFHF